MNLYSCLQTKLKKLEAVVFDLDDTLYLEQDYVFSGFRAVSHWAEKNLGLPADTSILELGNLFHQGVRGKTFDRWLGVRDPRLLEFVPKLVEVYREHEPCITPFPEALPLLSSLKQRYRLGLLSDGFLSAQQRKLKALKLEDWFDVIIFTDQWGAKAWKPSPLCFESLLKELSLSGSQCVYVGDNPVKDFLPARRLGIKTVRIRHPLGQYTQLEAESTEHVPDLEVQALHEIEKVLIQWGRDSTNH